MNMALQENGSRLIKKYMSFFVLIISDDTKVSTALRNVFIHCSYQVEIFPSIKEFTTREEQYEYDLIILDLDLEGQPLDLLVHLRFEHHTAVVITMTTVNTRELETKVRQQKTILHLVKTFDEQIILSVAKHIAMKKLKALNNSKIMET